jgi:hypothetical protein
MIAPKKRQPRTPPQPLTYRTMADAWLSYSVSVRPITHGDEWALRATFYAGATAMMRLLEEAARRDDDQFDTVTTLHEELVAFADALKGEH